MAGQQQPKSAMDGYEQGFVLVGAVAVIVVAMIVLWHFKRPWIVTPVFAVRHYEAVCIEFVLSLWTVIAGWLHLPSILMPNLHALDAIKTYTHETPDQAVTYKAFLKVNTYVGNWLRYPVIFILLVTAVLIKFFHAGGRFQTAYNMQKLKKAESKNWPQITPILSIDLLKQDLDEGPWAMARLPLDFCKDHDLLSVGFDEKEQKKTWVLKSNAAHSVFALQMGPIWRGVNNLPIEAKALVVIFLGRALKEREIANRFLAQISASAGSGKLNFSGIEEQLQKYADNKLLQWLEQRHAYMCTVMATLLEIGRSDGVLASAEFLWLKPVNRRLWYMLNTVGRATAVVEISGLYAHWLVEKKLGRPIKTPMIKEAVIALEKTIEDTLYIEEGDKWHTIRAA